MHNLTGGNPSKILWIFYGFGLTDIDPKDMNRVFYIGEK